MGGGVVCDEAVGPEPDPPRWRVDRSPGGPGSGPAAPVGFVALLLFVVLTASRAASPFQFDFGPGGSREGGARVHAANVFTVERGHGFEPGADLAEFSSSVHSGVSSTTPFFFTATLPAEGNYRVTVTLGHPELATETTIKAELRRLMVDRRATAPGEFVRETFVVNTRTHHIAAAHDIKPGVVNLKAPRETTDEAWAWDRALTLEFNGPTVSLCTLVIEPIDVPTIFLIGDSTVCDQGREPYNSWGQMLPALFGPTVAVANHGESGETYRDSIGRRRLDKIISVMQPGDWLLMQFGHNDQKQIAAGNGGPFTTYQEEMRAHIAAVQRVGGIPIIVTPMERRRFDELGGPHATLTDYAAAARAVAAAGQLTCLDLNAMSLELYAALGAERSARAFAAPGGKVDNTHHNNYGSYQLARCIVQAIREAKLDLARHVRADLPPFDPAHPDDPDNFAIPPSPNMTHQRPLRD